MAYTAAIAVVSDRIAAGERENLSGQLAAQLCSTHGIEVVALDTMPEGREPLATTAREHVQRGVDIVIMIGGTGIAPNNYTPEVTAELADARLHGLETQVLLRGLEGCAKVGLCRGIIGVTERGGGSLLINSASSRGAVRDTLEVVLPLVGDIFRDSGKGR